MFHWSVIYSMKTQFSQMAYIIYITTKNNKFNGY